MHEYNKNQKNANPRLLGGYEYSVVYWRLRRLTVCSDSDIVRVPGDWPVYITSADWSRDMLTNHVPSSFVNMKVTNTYDLLY